MNSFLVRCDSVIWCQNTFHTSTLQMIPLGFQWLNSAFLKPVDFDGLRIVADRKVDVQRLSSSQVSAFAKDVDHVIASLSHTGP